MQTEEPREFCDCATYAGPEDQPRVYEYETEPDKKNINKAQAQTLQSLARALHCAIEDLLEPVFTLDEVM